MYGYIGQTKGVTGEVAGSATAAQLPAALQMPCKRVQIRARSDNAATLVFIGFTSGVTVADGTSDATTGIELTATGFPLELDIQHTNQIWYICSAATADFTILILT